MANGLRPFAGPGPLPQRVSYVQVSGLELYIRNIIPDDMGIPSPAALALIGAGLCGLIVVSAYSSNFVEIEFSEGRPLRVARKLNKYSGR
jgi:hypothetical protein